MTFKQVASTSLFISYGGFTVIPPLNMFMILAFINHRHIILQSQHSTVYRWKDLTWIFRSFISNIVWFRCSLNCFEQCISHAFQLLFAATLRMYRAKWIENYWWKRWCPPKLPVALRCSTCALPHQFVCLFESSLWFIYFTNSLFYCDGSADCPTCLYGVSRDNACQYLPVWVTEGDGIVVDHEEIDQPSTILCNARSLHEKM